MTDRLSKVSRPRQGAGQKAAAARCTQGPRGRDGHAPDEAVQLQGAGAGGQSGRLAEVQAQGLLGLQAADQPVADGEPVQAGNEQLAGQQAALVHKRLVRLARGALVTACGEGTMGELRAAALPRPLPARRHRWVPGSCPGSVARSKNWGPSWPHGSRDERTAYQKHVAR